MDPYHDPIGLAAQGGAPAAHRHAADWGLGSLLLGLTLLVMAPLTVSAGVAIRDSGREELSPLGVTLTEIGVYVFLLLAVLAVVFGLVGLFSGFARNQPVGLAAAGLTVAVVALVLWVLMSFVLFEVTRGPRHPPRERFHHPDLKF